MEKATMEQVMKIVFQYVQLDELAICGRVCWLYNILSHHVDIWAFGAGNFGVTSPNPRTTIPLITDGNVIKREIGLITEMEKSFYSYKQMMKKFIKLLSIDGCKSTCSLYHDSWNFGFVPQQDPFNHAQIIQQLRNIANLKSLVISGLDTMSYWDFVCDLTNLHVLDLENSRSDLIPKSISKLTKLLDFRVFHLGQTEIPDELFALTSLQRLQMTCENIHAIKLSDSVSNLTNLLVLDVNNMTLETAPKSLKSLSIINDDIAVFPSFIFKLNELRYLCLNIGHLNTVPQWMSRLSLLETLNLQYCDFVTVPEVVCELTNLRKLSLSHNYIRSLPESISKLSKLNELDLNSFSLEELPESFSLPKSFSFLPLRILSLEDCGILNIPSVIFDLANLQILNLRGNIGLERIPTSITKLSNLDTLDLHMCGLLEFPDTLSKLSNLQYLYLGQNQICEIPEGICCFPNLLELHLNVNKLVAIPESFYQMPKLQLLALSCNNIQTIPNNFGCLTNLGTLIMINNVLRELPESFCDLINLQNLCLMGNGLEELPSNMGNLSSLSRLDLQENLLRDLPESFGKLNLMALDLANNAFVVLPNAISGLVSLRSFSFEGNYFAELPIGLCSLTNLVELNVKSTDLTELPEKLNPDILIHY